MDVVKALNFYRKSIFHDETAFEILCFLCKDGAKSEPEIGRSTGVEPRVLKDALRDLYQANFVRLHSEGRFALTLFGEEVLFQTGIGEIVVPFLVDEVTSKENASWSRLLAELAFKVEPDRARLASQSLRNLRVFLSHNSDTSSKVRLGLLANCISPTDSSLGTLLDKHFAEGVNARYFFHFLGHGSPNEQSSSLLENYREYRSLSRVADTILLDACSARSFDNNFSDDAARYLSFRLYNYIRSKERDSVLEFCAPQGAKNLETMTNRLWGKVSAYFDDALFSTQKDFVLLLDEAVTEKTKVAQLQNYIEFFVPNLDSATTTRLAEADSLFDTVEERAGKFNRLAIQSPRQPPDYNDKRSRKVTATGPKESTASKKRRPKGLKKTKKSSSRKK
jgi:hypothetical protein